MKKQTAMERLLDNFASLPEKTETVIASIRLTDKPVYGHKLPVSCWGEVIVGIAQIRESDEAGLIVTKNEKMIGKLVPLRRNLQDNGLQALLDGTSLTQKDIEMIERIGGGWLEGVITLGAKP